MFSFCSKLHRSTVRVGLVLVVAMIALLGAMQPAISMAKANAVTSSVFETESGIVANPAIVSCVGEPLYVTVNAHLLSHVTETAKGYHAVLHVNERDDYVGVDTGRQWHGNFISAAEENFNGLPFQFTMSVVTTIISPEPQGPSFKRHRLIHVTINADGTVTAEFNDVRLSCD